jgi:hypothetical protein
VTSAGRPEERSDKGRSLLASVLFGAAEFALFGAVRALVQHASLAEGAGGGAVSGLVIGALWFWGRRRAAAYRTKADPTRRTIAPSYPAVIDAAAGERVKARRYRYRPSLVLAVIGVAFSLPLAVGATAAGKGAPLTVGLWGMVALFGYLLATVWLKYTEVGRCALRVRTVTSRHTIPWHSLDEVRWVRESNVDRLLFRTTDGREIKSAGVVVTEPGLGRRAADRAFADIERTWAQHRAGSSSRPPG